MGTEIAKSEVTLNQIAQWNEKKALLKNTVAKGLTDLEFETFLHIAHRRQLDPILKQIYAIKRKGQVTFQVGIDGLRMIAHRTGVYAGQDETVFNVEDHKLVKATVTVYKLVGGVKCAFVATAKWDEYYPGEKMGFMWDKLPETMLEKCAEAKALRKAFPGELSGLYEPSEMDQAVPQVGAVGQATELVQQLRSIVEFVETSSEWTGDQVQALSLAFFNIENSKDLTVAQAVELLERLKTSEPANYPEIFPEMNKDEIAFPKSEEENFK